MDNHVRQLNKIFGALVKDASDLLNVEYSLLSNDVERITQSSISRGISIYVEVLPSFCSQLETALENGVLEGMPGVPFTSKGKPAIFSSIYSKIFDDGWSILSEPCIESIRVLRQLFKFAKKLRVQCPDSRTKEKYLEYERIEDELLLPSLSWGDDFLVCHGTWPHCVSMGIEYRKATGIVDLLDGEEDEFGVLRDLSFIQYIGDRVLRSFRYEEAWFRPKHGPGAVSEKFGKSKFDFPTWPSRLDRKFPYHKYAHVNELCFDLEPVGDSFLNESPARLIGVPKDYRGPRLIASEPVSSQYVQQGLLNVLRKNVDRSVLRNCIEFLSQEPSRQACLSASRTQDLSTIDLSSASDRLSCRLVESMFRSNFPFLEFLNAARTHTIEYPDGRVVAQKKFAAQGAAFTFPVQSIIYAIICMGVIYSHSNVTRLADLSRMVRVFGDDMIVPTRYFPFICRALTHLGLKVNSGKSFSKGKFRESCGMDAYDGVDITPASVLTTFNERSPDTLVSVVECSNNLFLKGFIRGSRQLLETVPGKFRKDLALKSSGSTVFGVLSGGRNSHLRTRYNVHLHRDEIRILTVESKVSKSSIDGHHRLLQWFHEKPQPDSVWKSGEVTGVKARYRLRWVDHQAVI